MKVAIWYCFSDFYVILELKAIRGEDEDGQRKEEESTEGLFHCRGISSSSRCANNSQIKTDFEKDASSRLMYNIGCPFNQSMAGKQTIIHFFPPSEYDFIE